MTVVVFVNCCAFARFESRTRILSRRIHDIHFPVLSAAIHSRHSAAFSLSRVAMGSRSFVAFCSHSAACFFSSAIEASAGTIFTTIRRYCPFLQVVSAIARLQHLRVLDPTTRKEFNMITRIWRDPRSQKRRVPEPDANRCHPRLPLDSRQQERALMRYAVWRAIPHIF